MDRNVSLLYRSLPTSDFSELPWSITEQNKDSATFSVITGIEVNEDKVIIVYFPVSSGSLDLSSQAVPTPFQIPLPFSLIPHCQWHPPTRHHCCLMSLPPSTVDLIQNATHLHLLEYVVQSFVNDFHFQKSLRLSGNCCPDFAIAKGSDKTGPLLAGFRVCRVGECFPHRTTRYSLLSAGKKKPYSC